MRQVGNEWNYKLHTNSVHFHCTFGVWLLNWKLTIKLLNEECFTFPYFVRYMDSYKYLTDVWHLCFDVKRGDFDWLHLLVGPKAPPSLR